MQCVLMHKRTSVAEIELDDAAGFIKKINRVCTPKHLPVGVPVKKGVAGRAELNEWWTDRSIPASRSGIRDALELLNISDTKMLLGPLLRIKSFRPILDYQKCSNLTWDKWLIFFQNQFSDVSEMYYLVQIKK